MGADGAAVNLGHRGGVIALLQAEIGSFIVPFHCMPHRLELGMLSVQREVSMIGQVYDLLHLIWKTYHMSPKSMRELKTLGAEIGVQVNAPSGVKGTRWLPHVSRSLSTLLKPGKDGNSCGQFTAVYVHMDHLAGAEATSAEIAGRAKKIKVRMEDGTFVAFCHFLSDLFSAIGNFSLQLQKNDVILPQAVSGIESLLATTEAMAASPKPDGKLSEFLAAMKKQRQQTWGESGTGRFKFQEVTLSKGEAAELAEGQSISQCAPRLQRAIVLTCDSTVKHLKNRFSSLLEENTKDLPTAKAVKCFNVFNHDSWPDNRLELLNHGVEEVNFLLQHFSTVLGRQQLGEFNLVQELQFHDDRFQVYFRLSREQFDTLRRRVGPSLERVTTNFKQSISPTERLAICLSYRVGISTVAGIIPDVCRVIWESLKEEFLPVPKAADWQEIAQGFHDRWNFPNYLRAFDGQHIVIQAPANSGSQFFSYKGTYSIVLLALVDVRYLFRMVDASEARCQA
ncbi:zinc finger protein 862-like [Myripristis murdjan]|uniref:zinc finger protein 862-like n=1 Tax=Myripristis murdjan TaxID=586833 RepID=UPI001175FCF6|nr:zinc finger protein 862-like [Myripristis murdjan]